MKKLVLLAAFLALFSLFLRPPTDPDLFWHLRYGEEILKTGQAPQGDQFSFTLPGYPWANSYWLSEVLIFYLFSKTGFLFPALFFSFLGAVTFLAVGFWARAGKANVWAISGAAFWGAVVSFPILGFRPQTISLALLGLVFILLHQFWLNKRPKLIFLLPLVFLLWTNLHAGFALGLVLIWLFWGAELGRLLVQKFFKIGRAITPFLTPAQLKILLGVNLFSSLISLINPYGAGLWQTILNDATSQTIKNQIAEWLAPNLHSEFGLLFFFYLLALGVLSYVTRAKIHPTRLALLGLFALLALGSVRNISIFALLVAPFLAEELTGLPWKKISFPHKRLALVLFLGLFTLAWLWQYLPQIYKSTRSLKNLAEQGNYPYGAVEYLKKHPQERIFSEYGWGGYLIWQLPESKTFIDGRMPGWKKKDGKEILEDYGKIIDLKKEGPELLESWQIETVLLPPDYPLVQYLKIHSDWEKIYEDKTAIIFARR